MAGWKTWATVSFVGLAWLGSLDDTESSATYETARPVGMSQSASPSPKTSAPTGQPTATPANRATKPVALMFITNQKDGDSFVASDGKEYRLGLVNTPEIGEPCAPEAAHFTRDFLSDGFTVDAYSTDVHGRVVAEVFDKSGKSLNVAVAKSGLGNDRYLEEFRHENPDLGRRLDTAFASAARPSCLTPAAPLPLVQQAPKTQEPASNCMTGYEPCLPVRGDMNCPEINHPVTVTGSDPYGLDRDGDGVGCD